jgi:hypothetical protein
LPAAKPADPVPDFYAAYPDEQLVNTILLGWGYNFYRAENQLRADDLMIRARVGELLCAARASIETAESAYRRAHLPPPSRANPRQDPDAIRHAQALEETARRIGALEGQIRALPVPETDHMTQRVRNERETLTRLLHADYAMVATATHLRALAEHGDDTTECLNALGNAISARREILSVK